LLHLVGINSFECIKMHGLTNSKLKQNNEELSDFLISMHSTWVAFLFDYSKRLILNHVGLVESYSTALSTVPDSMSS
jgi:hypothetical protein